MAFPLVKTTATSSDSGTSHIVNLPSGIVSGDLLIALFHSTADSTSVFPAGWNFVARLTQGASGFETEIFYRDADGTEGATITVTSPGSDNTSHTVYRIDGHDTANPPEAAQVVGDSTSPNPPNLDPAGGAKDILWLAIYGQNSLGARTGSPANYGSAIDFTFPGGRTVSMQRNLNASSENPGTYTTANSEVWVASTVAVHPAPPPSTAVLSGTITDDTENEIRAVGDSTIILTLSDDTWVATGGTFDGERQGIIDGIDSAQAEAAGWDAVVRPNIPVGNVVRTSDTVVTITVPQTGAYFITANEIVEATIPASALVTSAIAVVATLTFTITDSSIAVGGGSLFPWFRL